MRKFYLLLLLVPLLWSCKAGEQEPDAPEQPAGQYQYSGSLFVLYQSVEYETKNIRVDFVLDDALTATIKMYQVRFVPQMPVTVDLDVPAIPYQKTPEGYSFAGTDIVPTMGGNPITKYNATDIVGTVDADSLHLSLNFGSYPTRYAGGLVRQ